MNLTELRTAIREVFERAEQKIGNPSAADIIEARKLWELRREYLSNQIPSNATVKFENEPDWSSWSAIAKSFIAYHSAIVELQNAGRSCG
jgi:hypothetical protein